MPTAGRFSNNKRSEKRQKKLQYWVNKGCSIQKANSLIYRYGY